MSFVKKNLSTFMECQDALVTMHNKLTWDENQKTMALDKLTMLLQGQSRVIQGQSITQCNGCYKVNL